MKKIIAKDREHLKQIIEDYCSKHGWNADLNFIDVSKVEDLRFLFRLMPFCGNISEWDVSNVRNMKGMFWGSKFNGDISQWNTARVEEMSYMFENSPLQDCPPKWYKKDRTTFGDIMLPFEKCEIFRDKLETLSTREALSILYQYYGYRHLLSEECYNSAVEDKLIEELW